MFILLTVFLLFKYGMSTNSVYIYQTTRSSEELVITCTISGAGANEFSPHLHCPLIESHLCYTNCTSECLFLQGKCNSLLGLGAIYNCKYIYRSSDHIQIEYYIKSDNIRRKGNEDWYCSYKGINSQAITLNIPNTTLKTTKRIDAFTTRKYPPIMKRVPTVKPSVRQIKKKDEDLEIITLPAATSKVQESGIKQNQDQKDDMTFKAFITRFQVVIGILCLLIMSILLNIIFCIRDSFVKFYIENIKNNTTSGKCLLFCVCQRDPVSSGRTALLGRTLSNDTEYSKVNCHLMGSNVYDIDSMRQFIPQPCNFINEMMPSPNISRSRSFQPSSPVLQNRTIDQRYMSIPPGYSPHLYTNYPQTLYLNGNYGPVGGTSMTGSETPHEDFNRDTIPHIDSQGNSVSVRGAPNRAAVNQQNLDLINDFDRAKLSRSGSNVSQNNGQ